MAQRENDMEPMINDRHGLAMDAGDTAGTYPAAAAKPSLARAKSAAKPTVSRSLAEHDRVFHPDGFDPAHGSCKFRDQLRRLDEADRLVAFSDTHHADFDAIDPSGHGTIVLAGDIMGSGYVKEEEGKEWLEKTFIPWCERNADKNIVLVPGNHDLYLEDHGAEIKWPKNVTYLVNREANVNGLRVYGTPYTRLHANGAYEVGSRRLAEEFAKIPEGLDVLIAHTPPHVRGSTIDYDPRSRSYFGSAELTKAILEKKPKLVICGHVHTGSHRPVRIGDSTVVNVSLVGADRARADYATRSIGVTRSPDGADFIMDTDDEMRITAPANAAPSVSPSPGADKDASTGRTVAKADKGGRLADKTDTPAATPSPKKDEPRFKLDPMYSDSADFLKMLRRDRRESAVLLPDEFMDFYNAVTDCAKEINSAIDRGDYRPDPAAFEAMEEAWADYDKYRRTTDNPIVDAVMASAWEIAESARFGFHARINRVPALPTAMANPRLSLPPKPAKTVHGSTDPHSHSPISSSSDHPGSSVAEILASFKGGISSPKSHSKPHLPKTVQLGSPGSFREWLKSKY